MVVLGCLLVQCLERMVACTHNMHTPNEKASKKPQVCVVLATFDFEWEKQLRNFKFFCLLLVCSTGIQNSNKHKITTTKHNKKIK
jgi:hypothetical protein